MRSVVKMFVMSTADRTNLTRYVMNIFMNAMLELTILIPVWRSVF